MGHFGIAVEYLAGGRNNFAVGDRGLAPTWAIAAAPAVELGLDRFEWADFAQLCPGEIGRAHV